MSKTVLFSHFRKNFAETATADRAIYGTRTTVDNKLIAVSASECGIVAGNDSVPKIIINNTINLFLTAISILLISNHNNFRVLFDKIASVYFT